MSGIVSKCGINCIACPWGPYPRKEMTAQEFEEFRNRAKRILGYMPIKTPCVTCQTPDDKIPRESKLPNRKCLIRQCVDKSGIPNCASCARFPCDTLRATAGAWNRKIIEEKLGTPLSESDYHIFVEPFEGMNRLRTIRASLEPKDIVEPAKVSITEKKIVDFPGNMHFAKEEKAAFRAVHRLLATLQNSSLGFRDTDTFGQHHKLENLRAQVSRFLWILAAYGEFEKGDFSHLTIDAKTFLANRGNQKILAIWSFLRDAVFRVLSDLGITCERVLLKGAKEEDLVTGTDYMRSTGWAIKMELDEKSGGSAALIALQVYATNLNRKWGKKAFQYFQEVDMHVLKDP